MSSKPKRRVFFTAILLVALLSSIAYASSTSIAHAANTTLQQKGLAILNQAASIDLAKYETIAKEYPQDTYLGVPKQDVGYILDSGESKIKVLCTFMNGYLSILHVLEREGSPRLTKSAPTVLEMAKDFLRSYQSYSGDSFYGELESMLENVDLGKNLTKTSGTVKLEVTVAGDYRTFVWSYTFNGINAAYKCVALGYKDGFLKHFIDTWKLYPIGSTSVNLSESEAVEIAMESAKNFSWKVVSDNGTLEITDFNVTEAVVKYLVFCNSFDADNERSGGLLTLYPMWRIGIALDKFYRGDVYGIYVDVWADTKEIRNVQEVFSTLPPPADLTLGANESLESATELSDVQTSVESNKSNQPLTTWLVVPAFTVVLLEAASLWVGRKKKLPKHRSFKTCGLLLFLLSASMLSSLSSPISTVTADHLEGRATVWGSLAQEKTANETNLQGNACQYIYFAFHDNGYDSSNYQGASTLKPNALNNITSSEADYPRVATVWFDHGVGYAFPYELGEGREYEWHFKLCDSTCPNDNPFIGYVYDYEIWNRTSGKTFFAFISTCMSAKLDFEYNETYTLGNGTFGYNNGIPIGMPYAWTHRTVVEQNLTGFDVAYNMSVDGYMDPDPGDFCYIGFTMGSAALDQIVDAENYSSTKYYHWALAFFNYSLNYDMTINQALDHASYQCFSPNYFGTNPLHKGFIANWTDRPLEYDCTLVVYGNGDLKLHQPQLHLSAWDTYSNQVFPTFYIDDDYTFSTQYVRLPSGNHTFNVSDATGYVFDHFSYLGNNYSSRPATVEIDSDGEFTAYYQFHVNPPSVNGPTTGEVDTSYEFNASTTDYYDHDVQYTFNWGDGNQTVTGWLSSGATAYATHSWSSNGTYNVNVKAQCSDGNWSVWSDTHTMNINTPLWLYISAYDDFYLDELYPDVCVDSNWVGTAPLSTQVTYGYHYIEVDGYIWNDNQQFYDCFDQFDPGSYSTNPAYMPITSDTDVTAWYMQENK